MAAAPAACAVTVMQRSGSDTTTFCAISMVFFIAQIWAMAVVLVGCASQTGVVPNGQGAGAGGAPLDFRK